MKVVIFLAGLISAVLATATAHTTGKCFLEPFPRLLLDHITNQQVCGLNNPHVVEFVCEPVRGLVPDQVWLEFVTAKSIECESQEEEVPPSLPATEVVYPVLPSSVKMARATAGQKQERQQMEGCCRDLWAFPLCTNLCGT